MIASKVFFALVCVFVAVISAEEQQQQQQEEVATRDSQDLKTAGTHIGGYGGLGDGIYGGNHYGNGLYGAGLGYGGYGNGLAYGGIGSYPYAGSYGGLGAYGGGIGAYGAGHYGAGLTELDTAESELTAESEGHTAPTIKMLTDRITDTIKATTITRVSTKSSAIKVTTQDPVDITLETLDMLMEVLEALLHINSVDSQVHYVAHHQD
uniref:Uncharacterized protein n=1 Tax=Daphnia galeata TaxID=27404 RepID=A0A8J2RVF1_9CRUS|nr:unnamed protein product [Daphnia galeata]